jgi:hypothetical protein
LTYGITKPTDLKQELLETAFKTVLQDCFEKYLRFRAGKMQMWHGVVVSILGWN